ncbi:hypothetical protein BT69DRAFT_1322288 [Atractiella rhizophila]|nr:hypothetical protein BT69DRAFT_1322288 [Atractiella rhizophila]
MLFSNSLLSSRSSNSPLSKIWLASHLSSKLSKAAFLSLSIPTTIPSILEPPQNELPSLRVSGQLLLGVVRVYSRKAKYLYDDCGDALQRIKGVFLGMTNKGGGKVDMEEGEERADKRAITRRNEGGAWDLDWEWQGGFEDELQAAQGQKKKKVAGTANEEDITLPSTGLEASLMDDTYAYGMDMFDSIEGIGSQDYGYGDGLDLGLGDEYDLPGKKDGEGDEDEMDVELGRDASVSARRGGEYGDNSLLDGLNDVSGDGEGLGLFDKSLSEDGRGQEGFEMDPLGLGMADESFGPGGPGLDLGLDGMGMDVDPPAGREDRERTPREGEMTPTPSNAAALDAANSSMLDVTPRTAARINAALAKAKKTPDGKTKEKKGKKLVMDKEIDAKRGGDETAVIRGGDKADKIKKGMLVEPQFLPKSKCHLRLLEIDADPLAYYFPHLSSDPKMEFIYASAYDSLLAPELEEVFKLPKKRNRRVLEEAENEKDRGAKRARESTTEEEDVEHPRRRDVTGTPSRGMENILDGMDPSFGSVGGMGLDMGLDMGAGFQLDDMPMEEERVKERRRREVTASSGLDEMGLLGGDVDLSMGQGFKLDEGVSILSIFDEQLANESQANATQQKSLLVDDEETFREDVVQSKSGWSKNTVKALKVLNNELMGGDEEESRKEVVSFDNVAEKASKRAAASFFFELLVLNSRACVKLSQPEPFGDIEVKPQPKLWEMVGKGEGDESQEQDEEHEETLEQTVEQTVEESQEL